MKTNSRKRVLGVVGMVGLFVGMLAWQARASSETTQAEPASSIVGYRPAGWLYVAWPYAFDTTLNDWFMAGNAWEWCWDWYGSRYCASSPGSDPRGPSSGSSRVNRGGGCGSGALDCRVAGRILNEPVLTHDYVGFRTVLSPFAP